MKTCLKVTRSTPPQVPENDLDCVFGPHDTILCMYILHLFHDDGSYGFNNCVMSTSGALRCCKSGKSLGNRGRDSLRTKTRSIKPREKIVCRVISIVHRDSQIVHVHANPSTFQGSSVLSQTLKQLALVCTTMRLMIACLRCFPCIR
jgi:hypothetical protein